MLTDFFSIRVTRETAPEAIDKLQRRKLELEVEIHALEREKDEASKERLQLARKTIADVEDQLQPMLAAYEAEKARGKNLTSLAQQKTNLVSRVTRWPLHQQDGLGSHAHPPHSLGDSEPW